MALTQTISRENRIYLAIWRKAMQEKDLPIPPVTLTASSYLAAETLRRGLYRAIRPYREQTIFDSELFSASEHFSVCIEKAEKPEHPHTIVMKPKISMTELERELANLGLDDSDLLFPSEKITIKGLSDFIAEAKPSPRPSNPFYTRED